MADAFPSILRGRKSLGRISMDKYKRVDEMTSPVVGEIKRVSAQDTGFFLAASGAYGATAQRQMLGPFSHKYPLSYTMMAEFGPSLVAHRDGEVYPTKAPIPDDPQVLSNHIKSLAYFLKADAVGICELPQWALFSHDWDGNPVVCKHKYAIVILSEWDYETMSASTGDDYISASESFVSYCDSAHIAAIMAGYIRRLGLPARASFQAGPIQAYDMLVTPLVVLAGLGELSRAGWAVHPVLGGRFKASVVTTDLPLQPDKPVDFGLQRFCRVCKRCAEACPSRSISASDLLVDVNGHLGYECDMERCTKYRVMNQNGVSCGTCVKVCPWTKPEGWTHDLVRWAIRKTPALDAMWVKLDGLWGYGKQDLDYKWWFDLEEHEGVHRIPPRSRDNGLWTVEEPPAPPPQMPGHGGDHEAAGK